jgi:chromosome segregation ATPase
MSEIEQQKHDEEIHALHAEIKILRQQCNTNMEVLTRKERELAVLRDSLRVEDGVVGYISDDEPEDDVEEETPSSPNTAPPNLTHDYGPSQAEALATLLAHGRNHSFDSGSKAIVPSNMQSLSFNDLVVQLESMNAELAKARSDNEKAQRALKVEKESLSNAKMIISSLERANKSMMEDLRARLQDSNAAIASLLEKSMESEKTSAKLRAELESFKKSQGSHLMREEETALVIIPPTPAPLLLTETID